MVSSKCLMANNICLMVSSKCLMVSKGPMANSTVHMASNKCPMANSICPRAHSRCPTANKVRRIRSASPTRRHISQACRGQAWVVGRCDNHNLLHTFNSRRSLHLRHIATRSALVT